MVVADGPTARPARARLLDPDHLDPLCRESIRKLQTASRSVQSAQRIWLTLLRGAERADSLNAAGPVAELFAPQPGQPLSWNFSLLLGQLTDFFEATADVAGADTVINFSTQPCWLFNANATQCKPPDNPDEADM